ncbi:MAG: methyltransferase domain-containing protein [Cyanobacteria bacterium HKST-UBA02]|nr:methyltransferase domain-containing protein [Cyanobacteria bacterium HKST-UBA02]
MNEREKIIEFWNGLYGADRTPWDMGGVPARLALYLNEKQAGGGRVLIPGCGSGYEAALFSQAGFRVSALDLSAVALQRAREILATQDLCPEVSFIEGDFFEFESSEPFDIIYERAFLCSFPPGRRADYAEKCRGILAEDGVLVGFFFVDKERQSGPPYPIPEQSLFDLLGEGFELTEDEAVKDSLEVFAGRERFQVWKRIQASLRAI